MRKECSQYILRSVVKNDFKLTTGRIKTEKNKLPFEHFISIR